MGRVVPAVRDLLLNQSDAADEHRPNGHVRGQSKKRKLAKTTVSAFFDLTNSFYELRRRVFLY
ncbi:MAG TPA: hypothetical protein VN948_05850 [Terriglobales bacterium]|nr:hypothetical protein [Terriglobales bacterium]